MVLAARALGKETRHLARRRRRERGRRPLYRTFRPADAAAQPVKVTNTGDGDRAGGRVGDAARR